VIRSLNCWCERRFVPMGCAIAGTTGRCLGGRIWSLKQPVSQSSVTATSGTGAIGRVFKLNSRTVPTLTTGLRRLQQIGIGMPYSAELCERQAGRSSEFGRARSVGARKRLRARLLLHSNPRSAREALNCLKDSAELVDLACGKGRARADVRAKADIRHLARQILRDGWDYMRFEEP